MFKHLFAVGLVLFSGAAFAQKQVDCSKMSPAQVRMVDDIETTCKKIVQKPQRRLTYSDQSPTAPKKNAVRSAEQYLNMSGFSRNGLIRQLSSDAGDGYKVSDATAAVDSLSVDWNKQASRSAKLYLKISGFSCKGLIEQLSSDSGDQYTASQATYGAKDAGVCN